VCVSSSIIGEGFGFQCTYQTKHMIFLYYQGNLAILLFKTGGRA